MPEKEKILIWGKTYPELSRQHKETVCTGGCTEDGKPVRLYPVPLRYLPQQARYGLYDWIEVPLARNSNDPRPESFRVEGDIARCGKVGSEDGWINRHRIVFRDKSWQFGCVEDLKRKEVEDKTSIGLVKVGNVDRIWIKNRSNDEREKHERKLEEIKSQISLFDEDQRELDFLPFRIHMEWHCANPATGSCPGHTAGILDWGLCQLGRKAGPEAAKEKMQDLSNLDIYDLHLFMGNFNAHPKSFGIIGLWYPKIEYQKFQRNQQAFDL